jgi:multiple sugar transport system permease protein
MTSYIGRRTAANLAIFAIFVVYVMPLLLVVLASVKSNAEVTNHPASLVFRPQFDAFGAVVNGQFARALLNSVQIAGGSTILTILAGTPLAYVLSRARSRWTALTIGILIILQTTPPATSVIPLYRVLALLHVLGSLVGVIIAISAGALPFTVLLLRPFFLSVPAEVAEAAEIDGAGELRIFVSVVLPLVRNGVSLIAVLLFIGAWGEFLYALSFITRSNLFPLSILLVQQQGFYGTQYNNLMALALLGAVPTVVMFALVARRLTSGLALGAGK